MNMNERYSEVCFGQLVIKRNIFVLADLASSLTSDGRIFFLGCIVFSSTITTCIITILQLTDIA